MRAWLTGGLAVAAAALAPGQAGALLAGGAGLLAALALLLDPADGEARPAGVAAAIVLGAGLLAAAVMAGRPAEPLAPFRALLLSLVLLLPAALVAAARHLAPAREEPT